MTDFDYRSKPYRLSPEQLAEWRQEQERKRKKAKDKLEELFESPENDIA